MRLDSTPLRDRVFAHAIALTGADAAWDAHSIPATEPVSGGPYRGYVRLGEGKSARYAYFGGRTAWEHDGAHVSEGILFEVSGALRRDPTQYPSNGREFRAICEASASDDPDMLPTLRSAYRT